MRLPYRVTSPLSLTESTDIGSMRYCGDLGPISSRLCGNFFLRSTHRIDDTPWRLVISVGVMTQSKQAEAGHLKRSSPRWITSLYIAVALVGWQSE